MTPRAILYLRLSSTTDDSTSISRQRADLEDLAEREGWQIARVLTDDGISGRKARANADEALRMLRDDEADVLAVWKLDRWTRQGMRAVGDLVEVLDERPSALFVAFHDGIRSSSSGWRLIAAVLSEVARTEADNTATRVRSSIAYRAKAGRYVGGVVPFGYHPAPAPDGPGRVLVPDPLEASIVRDAVSAILGGEAASAVVRRLNAARVPTTRSPYRCALIAGRPLDGLVRGHWELSTLSLILTGDALLGRIRHRGAIVTDDDGLPLTAYAPILDRATSARLRAVIRDPRNPPARPRGKRAARLLSGVGFCAHCGRRLVIRSSGRSRIPQYACSTTSASPCPSPTIKAAALEEWLVGHFLSLVGNVPETALAGTSPTPDTDARLADIEAALVDASALLVSDDVDVPEVLARISALKIRRAELRSEVPESSLEFVATGRSITEVWVGAEDDVRRRAVLTSRLDHFTLRAKAPDESRKGFHAERISLYWAE